MIDDMGIFRTTIGIENPERPGTIRELPEVMVDTGSEYTWWWASDWSRRVRCPLPRRRSRVGPFLPGLQNGSKCSTACIAQLRP